MHQLLQQLFFFRVFTILERSIAIRSVCDCLLVICSCTLYVFNWRSICWQSPNWFSSDATWFSYTDGRRKINNRNGAYSKKDQLTFNFISQCLPFMIKSIEQCLFLFQLFAFNKRDRFLSIERQEYPLPITSSLVSIMLYYFELFKSTDIVGHGIVTCTFLFCNHLSEFCIFQD